MTILSDMNKGEQMEIKVIAVKVEEGVEAKLYINASGKACIRVRDVDAEENFQITIYPSFEAAEKAFGLMVA